MKPYPRRYPLQPCGLKKYGAGQVENCVSTLTLGESALASIFGVMYFDIFCTSTAGDTTSSSRPMTGSRFESRMPIGRMRQASEPKIARLSFLGVSLFLMTYRKYMRAACPLCFLYSNWLNIKETSCFAVRSICFRNCGNADSHQQIIRGICFTI